MYENKVLIRLSILSLNDSYELFIPVNEKIGNITRLLNNIMFDSIDFSRNIILINVQNGQYYKNNTIVRDTDIVNGTHLLLL